MNLPPPPSPLHTTKVICLVGLPASGKSTLASSLSAAATTPVVISSDAIETSLALPPLAAWRAARPLLLSTLRSHISSPTPPSLIIVDDPMHLRSMRKQIFTSIQSVTQPRHVTLQYVYLPTSLSTCLARNCARSSAVTADTIRKCDATFQLPGSPGRDGVPIGERENVCVYSLESPQSLQSLLSSPSVSITTPSPSITSPPPSTTTAREQRELDLRTLVKHAVTEYGVDGKTSAKAKKKVSALPPTTLDTSQIDEDVLALGSRLNILSSAYTYTVRAALHREQTQRIVERVSAKAEFGGWDVETVVKSLTSRLTDTTNTPQLAQQLASLIQRVGGNTHKTWRDTFEWAAELEEIIGPVESPAFTQMFGRVLKDGNWHGAKTQATQATTTTTTTTPPRPWFTLVTGVNGCRKTSSMYQPWFDKVLSDALSGQPFASPDPLPTAHNGFFRQLDYMIVAVASEAFEKLYEIEGVSDYSERKAALFGRFRTLSEMVGAILVKHAIRSRMNIMVETSGRDIAMYEYVERVLETFGGQDYRKLVVNFKISELEFAERSVDGRMKKEMERGVECLEGNGEVVDVNLGGPYGSEVLEGVQVDSEKVWGQVVSGEKGFEDWLKASVFIEGSDEKAWKEKGGELGKEYDFVNL